MSEEHRYKDCGSDTCCFCDDKKLNEEMENHIKESEEYRMVAGVVCFDVDILHDIVHDNPDMSKEDIIRQIDNVFKKKEELINDPKVREMRHSSLAFLFSLEVK